MLSVPLHQQMVYNVVFDIDTLEYPRTAEQWCTYVPPAFEAFGLYCVFLVLGVQSKLVVTAVAKRNYLYGPLLCLAEMKRAAFSVGGQDICGKHFILWKLSDACP